MVEPLVSIQRISTFEGNGGSLLQEQAMDVNIHVRSVLSAFNIIPPFHNKRRHGLWAEKHTHSHT